MGEALRYLGQHGNPFFWDQRADDLYNYAHLACRLTLLALVLLTTRTPTWRTSGGTGMTYSAPAHMRKLNDKRARDWDRTLVLWSDLVLVYWCSWAAHSTGVNMRIVAVLLAVLLAQGECTTNAWSIVRGTYYACIVLAPWLWTSFLVHARVYRSTWKWCVSKWW